MLSNLWYSNVKDALHQEFSIVTVLGYYIHLTVLTMNRYAIGHLFAMSHLFSKSAENLNISA